MELPHMTHFMHQCLHDLNQRIRGQIFGVNGDFIYHFAGFGRHEALRTEIPHCLSLTLERDQTLRQLVIKQKLVVIVIGCL
ncbi:hypothetical protein AW19_4161 (plasmid) [Yersinia frederiksenii Y225]|nr:hypothetical protein AW19_4161 [Yersinia frederiksenii Y225]